MKKNYIFLLLMCLSLWASAQITYEDFEGGAADLPWAALDGTYTGPVANPGANAVNSSADCGMYVKAAGTGYSLLLADNGATAFDMTTLNQFKMDVYTTVPTQVLFKLEGTGPAIEMVKNIGVTNAWQTYSFDFSAAAAYTGLTKVVIFFDPGNDASSDTYYFDNIRAEPAGPCAGVVPTPQMIDDFECNRFATYVNGWDSLTVVANPDQSGVNTSAAVGKYTDPQAEAWAALLIDNENPMDLGTFNQLHVKVWAPAVTQILFKLEGGASPPNEVWMDVTTPNTWVDYTVDFSSQALASHKKIVMFFNAGQDPAPGDVYYIDDIRWDIKMDLVIDDFEGGAFLPWEPLDQQTTLHGVFSVVANPDASGINTSGEVGKYVKGTSPFSTVQAVAPGVIDISTQPQYNLDVWAPTGATNVTMQLESPTLGNAEVTRDITTTGAWEKISFDFSDYQATNDWVTMKLLFKPGTAEGGTVYYYDNLTQGASTVDPCEGTVAILNIIDDYECQRNYAYGLGAAQITQVDNPDVTVVNNSTKVGRYVDFPNEPWLPFCVEMPDGINLDVFNQLTFLVEGPAVPILCKLEGGTSPASEVWTESTTAGVWEKITVDFSAQIGQDHKRVCIFLNGGVGQPNEDIYFLDNIMFAHAPFDGCLMNFDDPAFTSLEWKYFPADNSGAFELVDNPDQSGINTSAKVGKATEKATGEQPWQGMFADLPAPIKFGADKLVKMKVWSPQVATITMKLENPANPAAPGSSGDNTVANTVANAWEELTWDFSASPTPLPDNGDYRRVTLIWDIQNLPAADVIYYFDDVKLSNGNCGTVGTDNPISIETMSVSPNPATDMLRIENLGQAVRIDITDMVGHRIATINVGNDTHTFLNVSQLPSGMYLVGGYNQFGQVVTNAKFVKQ